MSFPNHIQHSKAMYNKQRFFEKAQEKINAHPAGFYVLSSVNIESFKYVNSRYGNEIGDQILNFLKAEIGKRISVLDGISGQIVGDDFVLLYPVQMTASKEIEDLQKVLTAPPFLPQKIRLRIGRYIITNPSLSIEAMFSYAKIAADSIRGNYEKFVEYYDEDLNHTILKKQTMAYEMERALATGQFEAWFQPQYNHATGALIGAEALARWNRDGIYISPAEFIPFFEQNGFIYEMDKSILKQCCILLRKWMDHGQMPLPLSVNISRRDLLHEDFVSDVTEIIHRYNISPDLIRFEITESAFIDSPKAIIDKVKQLGDMGYLIEIDDFGSGYSTLNILKDVPASILKLDMKFFENTENNQRAGNIIEAVVRMAKWLDMAVIAEGVEEKAQADYLKSIGCYYIQGYYYAKPMTVSQLEQRLAENMREPQLSRLKTLKTLDNNEFWNPKSMDTLIFNSYVGGACIFEYYRGNADLLRLNDQYIQQLSGIIRPDAELHESKISRFMNPSNKTTLYETIEKAIQTHHDATCEVKLSHKGQTEYLRVTVRAIAKTDDRVLCYSVIANITDQRLAEINERNMAKQLDTIMSNLHAAVTATIYHDKEHFNVIFINRGFYKLYGYTKEQYEQEVAYINDLILPEDRAKAMETVDRVMREKITITHELRCRKRDSSIIWIQMINSVVSLDGIGDNVLLGIATDITEQKENRLQLEFFHDYAHKLLTQPNGRKAIDQALKKTLEYFKAERTYILQIHPNQKSTERTFEIHSEHAPERTAPLPYSTIEKCLESLQHQKYAVIESAESDKVLLAPIRKSEKIVGLLAVERPRRFLKQAEHLSLLGDFISVALDKIS